jgi:hypothetical protein
MIKWIIAATLLTGPVLAQSSAQPPASSAAGSPSTNAWWLAEHPAQVPTPQP